MYQALLKIKITLALVFFFVSVAAQSSFLYFDKINTDNGLSHNKVNAILQDARGFIWIGTEDGLNRYDGKAWQGDRQYNDKCQSQ